MEKVIRVAKKLIPRALFSAIQPLYHKSLAFLGALVYRFPSRHIKIVAITGTKGKTSTAEFVNAILEEAGYKTALAGTLRFKTGNNSEPNLFKMTMPGRFFMQKFLRKAVKEKCEWAIIEMTSEGAKQYRHAFIDLDALIFTNLSPEHIESHGSYEKYRDAKLSLAKALLTSKKQNTAIIANADDPEGEKFLAVPVPNKFPFHLDDGKLFNLRPDGLNMMFEGEHISSNLRGVFNVYNILAAATFGKSLGISAQIIKKGIEKVQEIKGRVQTINAGQNFTVVVDYAHTPDSLQKLYQAFSNTRKICVLGNTGGGRDKWKRPKMGAIADDYCDQIILTNEDPYDEDPGSIVKEVANGITKHQPEIIMDRREAIRQAVISAHPGDTILITGKGTDPYIMGPNGSKTPWSDEVVAREEIQNLKEWKLTSK